MKMKIWRGLVLLPIDPRGVLLFAPESPSIITRGSPRPMG